MSTIISQTGNTQFVAANSVSQLVTFTPTGAQTLGQLLITNDGTKPICVSIGSANTVTATIANATTSSSSFAVGAAASLVVNTGQVFDQTPGNVYVAVIATGDSPEVYITPVQAS